MDVFEGLGKVAETIKRYNDVPLYGQIVEYQSEVLKLQKRNMELEKKLAAAEARLELKEKMTYRAAAPSSAVMYYWREGDPVPFCPKCWEGNEKVMHLSEAEAWNGGVRRSCLQCGTTYYEQPMNLRPAPAARFVGYNWSRG